MVHMKINYNENHTFRARWIQNPIFFLKGYQERRPADRIEECASEIRNVHTFYRHKEKITQRYKKAVMRVTADDSARIYINGKPVAMGPAQSLPCRYYYQIHDVTELVNGAEELMICAHVYYFGRTAHPYISADNLEGLLFEIELTKEDGSKEYIISDASWKCRICDAIKGSRLYGYNTQYSEDISMPDYPKDWLENDFDDSDWEKVCVRGTPYPMHYTFYPQPTPPAELQVRKPAEVREISAGRYVFDFGTEIVGTANLRLKGNKGDKVFVRYGEELNEDGTVRWNIRAGCQYEDTVILSGVSDYVEFFDYKGFRYMELEGIGEYEPGMLTVLSMSYPFKAVGKMSCSDSLFENIWKICENGVHWGTQDTYVDCPTREKGGFTGDAFITAFSHLRITGDTRIFKKFLYDIATSLRMDSSMTDVVPSYVTGGYSDYTLLIPTLFERYYDETGDIDTVKELIYVIDALCEIASGWENEDGLIQNPRSPISPRTDLTLIDWPPNLRGDFDFEGAHENGCSVTSILYYGFLNSASKLYEICRDLKNKELCEKKKSALNDAIMTKLYRPEKGLFADHSGTDHCSLHSNVPALCAGPALPEGAAEAITELICEKGLHCGVYFAYFVIRGLYNLGEYEKAWELLTNKSEYSWYSMVECGATTCMEVWKPDMKWNTSFCHPWSSSPVIFWAEEICGIKPGCPGWKTVNISPRIPKDLKSGSVTVPVPHEGRSRGVIKMSFERRDGEIFYDISVPCDAIFCGDIHLSKGNHTFLREG